MTVIRSVGPGLRFPGLRPDLGRMVPALLECACDTCFDTGERKSLGRVLFESFSIEVTALPGPRGFEFVETQVEITTTPVLRVHQAPIRIQVAVGVGDDRYTVDVLRAMSTGDRLLAGEVDGVSYRVRKLP